MQVSPQHSEGLGDIPRRGVSPHLDSKEDDGTVPLLRSSGLTACGDNLTGPGGGC
ncbi:MAG: hypothetical protein AB1796_02225 [Bacillota bacterium]